MHHPKDRVTHATAFDTPVVEHWLERETNNNTSATVTTIDTTTTTNNVKKKNAI